MSILEGARVGLNTEGLKASTARKAFPRLPEGERLRGRITGADLKVSPRTGNLYFKFTVNLLDDMGQTTNTKVYGNFTTPWLTPPEVLEKQDPPLPADFQITKLANNAKGDRSALGPNTVGAMIQWGRAILGEEKVPHNAHYAIPGDKTSGLEYAGEAVEAGQTDELHQARNAKVDEFFQQAAADTTVLLGYDIEFEVESTYENRTVTTAEAEELVAAGKKVYQGIATGFDNGPTPIA